MGPPRCQPTFTILVFAPSQSSKKKWPTYEVDSFHFVIAVVGSKIKTCLAFDYFSD